MELVVAWQPACVGRAPEIRWLPGADALTAANACTYENSIFFLKMWDDNMGGGCYRGERGPPLKPRF